MKITKTQLKQIIKEELGSLTEVTSAHLQENNALPDTWEGAFNALTGDIIVGELPNTDETFVNQLVKELKEQHGFPEDSARAVVKAFNDVAQTILPEWSEEHKALIESLAKKEEALKAAHKQAQKDKYAELHNKVFEILRFKQLRLPGKGQ